MKRGESSGLDEKGERRKPAKGWCSAFVCFLMK